MNILSEPTATKQQLLTWVNSKNPNKLAIQLLDKFWNISISEGVDPIIVFCQSMKETGYMKFGGVLDASFHNPCGLKIIAGGGNYDPNAHKRFNSWDEGILAHVQHLALYAGKEGYPLSNPVDPRHFGYLYGKCKTVESLSNNWAGSTYGDDIVKLCKEVSSVVIKDNDSEIDKIRKENESLLQENIDLKNKIIIADNRISILENKIKNIIDILK